jgi:hypothetical protein
MNRNTPLGRYRSAIRDGADPDPFASYMAHRNDSKVVLRTPSTVYGGEFRAMQPDMTWSQAWESSCGQPQCLVARAVRRALELKIPEEGLSPVATERALGGLAPDNDD